MSVAPPWKNDEMVTECPLCERSFGLLVRKHHCRACGGVFCGKCSEHSLPLPRFRHLKPVRVCDSCYRIESGEDGDNTCAKCGGDAGFGNFCENCGEAVEAKVKYQAINPLMTGVSPASNANAVKTTVWPPPRQSSKICARKGCGESAVAGPSGLCMMHLMGESKQPVDEDDDDDREVPTLHKDIGVPKEPARGEWSWWWLEMG